MSSTPFCFVVMPFRPELNYFYLYIQKHLSEQHGLRVERGDHRLLTKELMDKIRDQIVAADVIVADITSGNPNVFYEIGFAHAVGKPILFLTQGSPSDAPVDLRQFEFLQYDLQRHEEFLAKLDNAIQNVFAGGYRALYETALEILRRFNSDTESSYAAVPLEDFQARVMRVQQTQDTPSSGDTERLAGFLLPKVLREVTDIQTMGKVTEWVGTRASSA